MDDTQKIPFVRPARVGNFKIWRSRFGLDAGKGKGKENIECIYVSNLDGSWMVRIPATWEMFSILTMTYNDYTSDDEVVKSRGEIVLRTLLSNMNYATAIGNGFFQRALELIVTAYAHPSLLEKKHRKGLVSDAKTLIKKFIKWRNGYDEYVEDSYDDEQDEKEELAEQVSDEIDKSKESEV